MVSPYEPLNCSNVYVFSSTIASDYSWKPTKLPNTVNEELNSDHWVIICMAPWMQNTYGYNLSYPSRCHIKLGPEATYLLLLNRLFNRISTPSGSRPLMICLIFSWSITTPWSLHIHWYICRYPIVLPLHCNSCSTTSMTVSTFDWIFLLRSPRFFKILLRCLKRKRKEWLEKSQQSNSG